MVLQPGTRGLGVEEMGPPGMNGAGMGAGAQSFRQEGWPGRRTLGPLPESPDRAGAGAHGKPPYRNDRVVPVVITAHPRALPTVLQSAVLGPRSANSISK